MEVGQGVVAASAAAGTALDVLRAARETDSVRVMLMVMIVVISAAADLNVRIEISASVGGVLEAVLVAPPTHGLDVAFAQVVEHFAHVQILFNRGSE